MNVRHLHLMPDPADSIIFGIRYAGLPKGLKANPIHSSLYKIIEIGEGGSIEDKTKLRMFMDLKIKKSIKTKAV